MSRNRGNGNRRELSEEDFLKMQELIRMRGGSGHDQTFETPIPVTWGFLWASIKCFIKRKDLTIVHHVQIIPMSGFQDFEDGAGDDGVDRGQRQRRVVH